MRNMMDTKSTFVDCFCALGFIVMISGVFVVPVVMQMLVYTLPILYIACHLSLPLLQPPQEEVDEDGNKTGVVAEKEVMSLGSAKLAPVFGSAALLSLYFAYKFLGKVVVNFLVSGYFGIIGSIAVGETFVVLFKMVVKSEFADKSKTFTFNCPYGMLRKVLELKETDNKIKVSMAQVICHFLSLNTSLVFCITKHWIPHNILGMSFCMQAISMLSLGKFKTAFILLSGLFVYDIVWVFGSDVMVTVAKGLEAPIKLIFPISHDPWKQSILGLGDIVVPGLSVSLSLRFDAHRAGVDKATITPFANFSKPYFWTSMAMYALALILTCFIMIVFDHAQPALLYLVPAMIFANLGCAKYRGELAELWAYSEEPEEKKSESGTPKPVEAVEGDDAAEEKTGAEKKDE